MKYCSQCGGSISLKIPQGDNRERHVCAECEHIHYVNPKVVTGCLPVYEDKVLMCRRAIAPREGLWTLPAGFLENGETASEGALREMMEEANARGKVRDLYTMFSLPHISQIYLFYLTDLADLDFFPGEESHEVSLFTEAEIPWDQLAFPVILETLTHYFQDRQQQHFPMRAKDLIIKRQVQVNIN